MRYEDFCTPSDVAAYRRVKRVEGRLAHIARNILCEMVGGVIGDGRRSAKEFVQTRHGKFRVSLRHNSDNTTEQAAHARMGVTPIALEEPDISWFFQRHDLEPTAAKRYLADEARRRLQDDDPGDTDDGSETLF